MNKVSLYNKEMYGEVTTTNVLIDQLFDMLDDGVFVNDKLKWLDPCAGTGVFFERLFSSRLLSLPSHKNNLFWMTEINQCHTKSLKKKFVNIANVKNINYLDFKERDFDIIVGNPPFQVDGSIKVPTKKGEKTKDGKEMWSKFITHSVDLLKDGGILLFITPAIWLKKDHKMHKVILQYKLEKMACYDAGEANKLFKGNCQTPIVLFKLVKEKVTNKVQMTNVGEMLYRFHSDESIPMKHYSVLSNLKKLVEKVGCLKVIKTSMRPGRPKGLKVNKSHTDVFRHKNIRSCVVKKGTNGTISPKLVVEYSNIPCVFNKTRKLVLAHKMYGYCYYDKEGEYGISNRDNYVLVDYTEKEMEILNTFLNLECIVNLFDATRYRMRYLEKYIFDFIPDITSLPDFPKEIEEQSVLSYIE